MTHAAYLLSSIDLSQKNLASLWPLSHICIYWAIPGKAVPWEVSATQPLSEITGANMKKQKSHSTSMAAVWWEKTCVWLKEQVWVKVGEEKKGKETYNT